MIAELIFLTALILTLYFQPRFKYREQDIFGTQYRTFEATFPLTKKKRHLPRLPSNSRRPVLRRQPVPNSQPRQ